MKTNHMMCTSKILTDLCFTKQRIKTKNTFVRVVYSALVVKMCRQSVKIEFKNYFKEIPVPFKIYADFECNLKSVKSYEGSYSKNIKITFLVVLLINFFVLMMNVKPIVVFRGENAAYEFIEAILKEYEYCKKVMKKHFNKNLIMTEEELFQSSNICWICEKLIENGDGKVSDHCHITGKFRGAAHWSCNINLQLTKKVPVIFHNLRGYDSHLIFCELNKFDVKIDVIPNRLEKYMAFFFKQKLSLY